MAKFFSDHEKKIIRDALMEKGREQFSRYGLKKTSIEELCLAVSISKGSFYAFFPSKEDLYLDLCQNELDTSKTRLAEEIHRRLPLTKKILKQFLLDSLDEFESKPLLRQLLDKENQIYLLRKAPRARMKTHTEQASNWMLSLIHEWQRENTLVDRRPEVIAAVLRSFFFLVRHKDELGEDIFSETTELLAESIAAGLVQKKKRR